MNAPQDKNVSVPFWTGWSARLRVIAAVGAAFAVALVIALFVWFSGETTAAAKRPVVAYMSSIALATGEGDIADVVAGGTAADPFFLRLSEHYDMRPVDDLTRAAVMNPDAVLLIQPRAFRGDENVAIDAFVRGGGRMILLTDPVLSRESRFPIGDKRRPLFTGLAAPLLAHWGLEMTLPLDEAEATVTRSVGDFTFDTAAPGAFVYKAKGGSDTAPCRIKADGLIAQCDFGEGRAVVIADADLIDPRFWNTGGVLSNDDGPAMIEAQLAAMTAR